jgi:oxygen-independent coproporphyrinogen-3 oxidase
MTEQTTHFDKAERSLDNGGGNYVGFGAAAHSLLNNVRYNNTDDIDQYITACDCRNLSGINVYTDNIDQYIAACGRCVTWHERTPDEIRTEQIMLGLRTTNGIPYDLVADKTTEIQFLQQQKLIKIKYGQVIATAKGFRLLNQIILKLV